MGTLYQANRSTRTEVPDYKKVVRIAQQRTHSIWMNTKNRIENIWFSLLYIALPDIRLDIAFYHP